MRYYYGAQLLQALEDAGGAHASSYTHGDHAVAGVFALQVAEERGGEFRSGAAERVAESDGPAAGIHARGIKTSLLNHREGLRGKGFVQLNHRDVVERKAGELESLGNSEHRTDAEFLGWAAGGGVGDEASEWLPAQRFGARVAHDHGGG